MRVDVATREERMAEVKVVVVDDEEGSKESTGSIEGGSVCRTEGRDLVSTSRVCRVANLSALAASRV